MLRDVTPSSIVWIGSLQAFLSVSGGIITGPLYDREYLRTLVRTGSALVVIGLAMTSLCDKYWQLMLAQGLFAGLGNAMFFVQSMALLPTYFVRHRALSMGASQSPAAIWVHSTFRHVEDWTDSRLRRRRYNVFRRLPSTTAQDWIRMSDEDHCSDYARYPHTTSNVPETPVQATCCSSIL
jgi:hypothetical protein